MTGQVSAEQVLQLMPDTGNGPARDFVAAMQTELEAMPPGAMLDVVWGAMQPSLHAIYSVHRGHLAERGADVCGLDALLATIERSPEGTGIGGIVVKSDKANLIAMCDHDVRTLIGWAVVPLDLPSLEEVRSGGEQQPSDGAFTLYRPVGQTELDLIAEGTTARFRLDWTGTPSSTPCSTRSTRPRLRAIGTRKTRPPATSAT